MACKAGFLYGIQCNPFFILFMLSSLGTFLIPLCTSLQEVLKSTRTQLERELSLEDVSSVKDLPAFNMLNR